VSMMGAGLRPHGKPWDQPPYPKMQSAPHFYPDLFARGVYASERLSHGEAGKIAQGQSWSPTGHWAQESAPGLREAQDPFRG